MAFWNNKQNKQQSLAQQPAAQDKVVKNNPNYGTFNKVSDDIATVINSRSVVSQLAQQQSARMANPVCSIQFGDNMLALPVASNKNQRISQYRQIAAYPVCRWCLDQIADDFIHDDETKEFIKLKLPDRLTKTQKEIIQNEFKKFIGFFNLRDDGYNIIRRFLTEGELAWENVIKPEYPDLGIIGVKFLPAEYYETLIDTKTADPIGIVFDTDQFTEDKRQMFSQSFAGSAAIFNTISPTTYSFNFRKQTSIPLLWNQVTYISSGELSPDGMISYPLIENAKQQYHRLALMEDAAVILRVTHAPERLCFNLSTGKMNQNYADEYVRRFAMELKSKKVATPDGRDIMGVYDPPTMLKSFVFSKSSDSDGTSVESIGSSASYSEMEDIEYFMRAMLKQFNIPWSRWKTPENTMEKQDNMSQEEYTFSRMIMRFQRRFATGFKRSFITHLKLRGIWDKDSYSLLESDIDIAFVNPVLYDLYETQKLVEAKMAIFNAFKDTDFISPARILKKYLGWTDEDIQQNYMDMIKDKQMTAVGDFFSDQVTEENPPVDFKSPIRLKKDVEAEEKINHAVPSEEAEAAEGEGEEGAAEEGGAEEAAGEEKPEEEAPAPEAPSFGLN